MAFLAPHGEAIIDHLQPTGAQVVLDIAAGTGEPGLSLARMLSGGRVVLTDLADGMLQVAREKAAAAGAANVEFRIADACELPFEDESFDAVSCRLGFMFFPDMELAAREMVRVLKPGGRLATTVWSGPERNYWVTCMMQNIKRHIDMPAPAPGAPGMFRCAEPGLISPAGSPSPRPVLGYDDRIAAPFSRASLRRLSPLASMHQRHPEGSIDACGMLVVGVK